MKVQVLFFSMNKNQKRLVVFGIHLPKYGLDKVSTSHANDYFLILILKWCDLICMIMFSKWMNPSINYVCETKNYVD